MKRLAALLARSLFLTIILAAATAYGQNDIENPDLYEGAWYRIALAEDGTYMLGDGHGYAAGTWYYYPQSDGTGWWRQWYYNGPCDPNREGQLDYVVYIKAVDPNLQTSLEVRFNWATPEWSALGKQRPPLPADASTEELQELYMDSHKLHNIDNWFIGTFEPIKSYTVSGYNPEWVSIDIRGYNAYVYRGAHHSCAVKDPLMGACYDSTTGDCYTGYEQQCRAPYVWQGADTSCSDYMAPEVFPVPVYRFWLPAQQKHVFTTSEREKDDLLAESEDDCSFEGIGYCALVDDTDPNCRPVHRFWSTELGIYSYIMQEAEEDDPNGLADDTWTYDEVAFYAYPEGSQPDDSVPVYRFWSESSGGHFYTISEEEKNLLFEDYSHIWFYEGVAWYAYEP